MMCGLRRKATESVHLVLRSRKMTKFTSGMFHQGGFKHLLRRTATYTEDSGIIGHLRGLGRLVLLGRLDNGQVLDIAATEHNVVVDLVIGRDLVVWVAATAFGTERLDIFQSDCRVLRVDLV